MKKEQSATGMPTVHMETSSKEAQTTAILFLLSGDIIMFEAINKLADVREEAIEGLAGALVGKLIR